MGDDSDVAAFDFRISEDATNGGELFTIVATYDASFLEEGVNGDVGGGQCTGMGRSGTAAGSGATRLDGCDVASLADQ